MPIDERTGPGRYDIRSQLGAGGMGEVYLAEDMRLHRKEALTALPADQDRTRHFAHEARVSAARSLTRTSRTFTNR